MATRDATEVRAPQHGCLIYLVRHGRTLLNAQGRFRGRENPSLDAVGRAEADRAADRLRNVGLREICSSPLARARETAGAIASPHALGVTVEPDLRDLDYGSWSGRTPDEVARTDGDLYRRFLSDPVGVTPPGGERVGSAADRVVRALHRIALRNDRAEIAAVTHDVPIRLVLAHAAGLTAGAVWELDVPTGSIRRLQVTDARVSVVGEL